MTRFRSQLQKLPDKGVKIQELYDRAVKALETKQDINSAAQLLSDLNLGTNEVNNIEWKDSSERREILDSDDDEDPVAILVSSNSVNQNKRILKHSKEDENENSLITEEDIKEAQEIMNGPLHLDPVLEIVCKNENMDPPNRFLPYKSTSNSVRYKAAACIERRVRDNTAATPPVHNQGVKLLSLRDSIETEYANRQNMKVVLEKQATERLATKAKELATIGAIGTASTGKINPDSSVMTKYRLATSLLDELDAEEAEEFFSEEEEEQ